MKHSFLLISLAVLALAACALTPKQEKSELPLASTKELPAIDISGYKSWTKATKEPHLTNGQLSMSCVAVPVPDDPHSPAPAANGVEFESEQGKLKLSTYAYITIYVNEIGEPSLLKDARPNFPEGSIIVKERHSSWESKTADYITVMRKLPAGTKPETGDWQYLVYAQDAKTELKKHNLPDCMSCHAKWKDTDYVSREYLTQEQLAALK
ncbi:MAG: cytochrome P460 family protein [Fimbriimonadaceae bacterium]|nr:MAG: cytochrome P460 family protein [Fimbriimonadaceae bacterium]